MNFLLKKHLTKTKFTRSIDKKNSRDEKRRENEIEKKTKK